MKKNITKWMLLMLLSLTFTACETEDEEIARGLEGTWRGTIEQTFFDDRYGRSYTEYTDVLMEFYNDPGRYAKGSGREVDYGRRGVSSVVEFSYEVRNRIIYLDYADGYHIAIYNWDIYYDTFTGEFHDYYSGEYLASFRLYYVSEGWNYGYNYYAKRAVGWPAELDDDTE